MVNSSFNNLSIKDGFKFQRIFDEYREGSHSLEKSVLDCNKPSVASGVFLEFPSEGNEEVLVRGGNSIYCTTPGNACW